MRIIIESSVLTWQLKGGISRYIIELSSGLKKHVDIKICTWFSKNIYYKNRLSIPLRGGLALKINSWLTNKVIKYGDYDLLHVPSVTDYYFNALPKHKPLVVTFHDLICEVYPGEFNEHIRNKTKRLAEKATRIIAISENTKKDLVKYYGIEEKVIDVIYHGPPFDQQEINNCQTKNKYGNYLLFVGYRGGYKNFENFCKSLPSVIINRPDLRIVLVGGRNFSKWEKELINSYNFENIIVHLKTVSDTELIGLYKHAMAFVFPSLYEGFGLPILEAFACETPVICSNTSSIREVADDAAQYFEPQNIKSISEAIISVINSEDRRWIKRFKMCH